jgi:S1-C subfamily serine protease
MGQDIDSGLADAMNLDASQGAFVSEVSPDSAAEKGGILAGDIITEINGRPVVSFQELRAKVASKGAGAELELTVLRKGKSEKIDVVLSNATQNVVIAKEIHPALEGATLTNGKTQQGDSGIVISDIEARSPASRIGLQDGDVIIGINRKKVDTLMQLRTELDGANGVIALNVKRGISSLYLVIRS